QGPAGLRGRRAGAGLGVRLRVLLLRVDPGQLPPPLITGRGWRSAMQRYYLTDEQRMVMELARSLAREKIAPIAAHHAETETYPEEAMRLLGQQGLFGIWVPEAYGGTEMGALAVSLVAEEIAWACAATATNWGATPLGGYPIVLAGTEEQKRRYLPRL